MYRCCKSKHGVRFQSTNDARGLHFPKSQTATVQRDRSAALVSLVSGKRKGRTYPLTQHPARELRKRHAPATSSAEPMRASGTPATTRSPAAASVAAIILDWKGPQARVLLVIPLGPSWAANTRESWCSAALDAESAQRVSLAIKEHNQGRLTNRHKSRGGELGFRRRSRC